MDWKSHGEPGKRLLTRQDNTSHGASPSIHVGHTHLGLVLQSAERGRRMYLSVVPLEENQVSEKSNPERDSNQVEKTPKPISAATFRDANEALSAIAEIVGNYYAALVAKGMPHDAAMAVTMNFAERLHAKV